VKGCPLSRGLALLCFGFSLPARALGGKDALVDGDALLPLPSAKPADRGASGAPAAELPPGALRLERPFAFVLDPSLPPPLRPMLSYAAAYSTSAGATRPLAATASRAGLVNELRIETAVIDRLAPFATGLWAAPSGESQARLAANAGIRTLLTDPLSRDVRLTTALGYLRDFAGADGGFLEVTASADLGRLRLAGSGHAERVLDPTRDAIDLYTVVAASYRLAGTLRAGAEHVAQDLEGAWEPDEAEGGLRHFVSVTLAWSSEERLFLALGPALGLSQASPDLLGRATLSYLF
jgi:hypothetical protein